MKKKGQQDMKKSPLLKFSLCIVSAIAGALLVYFVMYLPAERELEQYKLAYYLSYELTESREISVTEVWWETNTGHVGIPVNSLLLYTSDGYLYAVHPNGKVSQHKNNGLLVKYLQIKIPNAIVKMDIKIDSQTNQKK